MSKRNDVIRSLITLLNDRRMMGRTLLYKGVGELNMLTSINSGGDIQEKNPVLQDLSSDVLLKECEKCPDIVERKASYGSGANRVMIIMNSPVMANRVELSIHRAESSELLRKMVSAIDLNLKDCYVTNLVKCESSSHLLKPSDMVKNCMSILQKEIDTVKPLIIVVMGDIIPLQKIVNSSKGITWFNTEHTISIIKNPELKRPAWETLKLVRKKYSGLNDDSR